MYFYSSLFYDNIQHLMVYGKYITMYNNFSNTLDHYLDLFKTFITSYLLSFINNTVSSLINLL